MPSDSDGVAMNTLDLDVDNNAANDRKNLGVSAALRFGRLRLFNQLGSEKLPLRVPMLAQYWNGSGFVTNTDDSCSSIPRAAIALDFAPGTDNLDACETAVNTDPVTFSSGIGSLTLAAPGAANNGTVLLTVNLGSAGGSYCNPGSFVAAASVAMGYLLGRWNDASNPDSDANTSYDDKPSARAAFGVYGAQPKNFIFFRENF